MKDQKTPEPELPTIPVYYQRGRHYRTIEAEGAQAGITPRGKVQFTLFSELRPTPEFVLHRVSPTGNLGDVLEQVVKEGIVREVEVNVVMDLATTVQFIDLLQRTLQQIQALSEQRKAELSVAKKAKPHASRAKTTKHRNR
jgi:hypothetical protein